ncbi:MAG TPA: glycosyltransferase, partial [Bacteroidetes bacterium]|nr:glycosyltransferase [Bacteroidota bacterium]
MGISVILITRNEVENIRECLESVQWADEIIVVDAESEDETAEIAR